MLDKLLSWSLALTLSALLLAVSLHELLGPQPNALFGLIAARSGLSLFEPGARYLTAALQLVAVALILWSSARALGAGLAAVVAAVALGLHLTPWLGVFLPAPEPVTAALAAGHTAAEIDAMRLPTDGGGMFLLALAILVLAVATLYLEWAKGRPLLPNPLIEAPNGAALTRG